MTYSVTVRRLLRDLLPGRGTIGKLSLTITLIILATAFFLLSHTGAANNIRWDGGGTTNNWSEAANWSSDTVPGSGDVAIFDGTSTKDATVDPGFAGSVAGIQIDSGYTGTITHTSGATLTVGGNGFVQSVGSFTGGINNININGAFTLDGGTFNAPSGTVNVSSFFTVGGAATFNPNGGTVAFVNGQTNLNLPASLTLNNITINKNASGVFFLTTSTLIATGTLTLTDGAINTNVGVGTIDAQGAVTIGSTFDGGTATLRISGAATRTVTLPVGAIIPPLTLNAPNVTLNASGAGTITFSQPIDVQSAALFTNGAVNFVFSIPFSSGATNFTAGSGDLTFNSGFTQTGGTFTPGSGALNFNSTFSLSGGTFNAPSGTLPFPSHVTILAAATFNPNGGTVALVNGQTNLTLPPSLTLNNIAVNKNDGIGVLFLTTSTLVATGTLTLTDGFIANNSGVGTIDAQAAVTIASTFDGGSTPSPTLLISGAATRTVTLPVGAILPALTVNAPNVTLNTSGAPGTITFSKPIDVQSAASFTNGAVNFVFSIPFTFGAATNFAAGSGDLTFDSSFTQTGGTFTPGSGALNFNSTFNLNGGTFNAPSGTLSLSNHVTIAAAATFNPNGGTVAFVNGQTNLTLPATFTLNNITINKNDGVGVLFLTTSTLVATGTLTLTDGFIANNSGVGTIDAQAAVSIASTFDGGSANISFSGPANQTLTNNGGVNPSGTWTVNKTAGVVTLASDLTLGTGVSLNVTSGMLNQGASFNLTAGTITVEASGVLRNYGTGGLTIGNSVSNSGSIEIDGGGPSCGDADSILIRSSSDGIQRSWSGAGNFMLRDVDVKDQAGVAVITVFGGTDSGNNGANWTFNGGCGPTEVTLESFSATSYKEGLVLLQWRTGFEVRNLGFNIYRDEGGTQVRINPSMLAGSALVTRLNTALTSGRSYSWIDKTPGDKQSAQYRLEDVDLNGQSTWHGPVAIQKSEIRGQKSEADQQALTLSEIGNRQSPDPYSPLEAKARTAEISSASIQAQASLASQPAARIAVKREGWYRVTQAELDAAGFNTKADPRLLRLFVDGIELPIIVSGEQDARFDSTDAVEFYGVGLDSPFTDSRVYWLVAGDQAGLRIRQAKTGGMPSSSQSFTAAVERRDRTIYFSGLRNGEKENFFGAVIAREPVDQQLTLSHLARADSSEAQLEIALQGVTVTDHRVSVELNGAHVGEVVFNGQCQSTTQINVAHSMLREGNNVVRLTSFAGASDVSLVDYLRISYSHSYTADNDALRLTAPGLQRIDIEGFTSDSIRVVDVTSASQEVIGVISKQKAGYAVSFAAPEGGERSLLAFTTEQHPASLSLNQPSNLRGGAADFIIVTRREFADSLTPLATLRRSQGLSVALVDVEDIYDEFSFGQKTPFAVRDFLAYAKSSWKKKPRFVLLAGDASYDPKNHLGFGDSDLVPTKLVDTGFMETSSDDWLCDFNNDGIADIATGRLSARTADELSAMVSKIVSYEHSGFGEETLLVADANDGFDFEQASAELRSLTPTSLRITQVNRGRLDPEMARSSLFEALYRRQFLVNYAGHGSVNQWRGNLLTNDDAVALRNEHLTMFVMMTCLNGYFQDPALDSLGESLMKAEQGGAIAVWASSGMTMPADQALLNQELYRLLFNRGPAFTIGEAVLRAKASVSDSDIRRTWILLGDPAMKLR